jgi:hypothetical protein
MTSLEKLYLIGSVGLAGATYVGLRRAEFGEAASLSVAAIGFAVPVVLVGVPQGTRILAGLLAIASAKETAPTNARHQTNASPKEAVISNKDRHK